MAGKVWCFSCCKKRNNRGERLSKKGKEIHGVSLQTEGIISHINDSYENGRRIERSERTTEQDCGGVQAEQKEATGVETHVHPPNLKNKAVIEVRGVNCVDKAQGSVAQLSAEQERAYQLLQQQLEALQKENQELETQVLQANQNVRDLRHEKAASGSREPLAKFATPMPTSSTPSPPPVQPHVNPLRALMKLIQNRRNSRDPNHSQLPEGLVPEGPENTDIPYNHRCPGMNEVLEMIRNGVSLRHVIQAHKGSFQTEESESEPGSSQLVPELHRILKKRRVSADNHVSDGSCDDSVGEDLSGAPVPHGPDVQQDRPTLSRTPRQCHFNGLGLRDDASQDTRGTDDELDEEQSDGDVGSTTSTLPLNTPLDPGQVDLVSGSLPESPAPPVSAGGNSMDFSSGQPQMEQCVCVLLVPPDPRTNLIDQDCPVSHNNTTAQDPTDENPMPQYLNWGKHGSVDLKDLPLKSIFKSVSGIAVRSGNEVPQQNQWHHRQESAPLEALESDHSFQRFRGRDFCESVSDPSEGVHTQFAVLHDMLKPPLDVSEECQQLQHASVGNEVLSVLSQDSLEESVDGPEQDSPLPENEQALPSPGVIFLEEGESAPSRIFLAAKDACEYLREAQFGMDRCHLPAASFFSVVEEERF